MQFAYIPRKINVPHPSPAPKGQIMGDRGVEDIHVDIR